MEFPGLTAPRNDTPEWKITFPRKNKSFQGMKIGLCKTFLKTFLSLSWASATSCETKALTDCWQGLDFLYLWQFYTRRSVWRQRMPGAVKQGSLFVPVEIPTVRRAAPCVSFASPRHPSAIGTLTVPLGVQGQLHGLAPGDGTSRVGRMPGGSSADL